MMDGFLAILFGGCSAGLATAIFAFSPAKVIDTKDLDALSKIVEMLARKW
jgi:hypothetical protein